MPKHKTDLHLAQYRAISAKVDPESPAGVAWDIRIGIANARALDDRSPIREELLGPERDLERDGYPQGEARQSYDFGLSEECIGDLADGAAAEAANYLIDNWLDAIGDGMKLADLVSDVDDVVTRLLEWKEGHLARLVKDGWSPMDEKPKRKSKLAKIPPLAVK